MFRLTPMVRNLLIINLVVFLLMQYQVIDYRMFALYDFRSPKFEPYQFLTHMFLHAGWGHIFSNMLSLFIFGPMLEHHWGGGKFLTFYLICGMGASLLFSAVKMYEVHQTEQEAVAYVANPTPVGYFNFVTEHYPDPEFKKLAGEYQKNPDDSRYVAATIQIVQNIVQGLLNSPMLGASGAVFGILMAFGMLFPNMELFLLFFPFPIKAKYFVLMYGAYELYSGFNRMPGDNVAHFAHLGGMLFAYILLKIWERQDREYY